MSEAGDLRFHLSLRAVADPNHRDDRANTNDDAERGQHGPHFVPPQCAKCDVKCWYNSHTNGSGVMEQWSSGVFAKVFITPLLHRV